MRKTLLTASICIAAGAQSVSAQSARFLDVGSETERVLRVLQLTGDVPLYPWSIREFSPAELDRLMPRSTSARALLPPESPTYVSNGFRIELLPMEAGLVYNSAYPYGSNDGPLWAGKGFTGSYSAGVAARIGPLSMQLEPTVFDAQNASFPLKPTGVPSNPFANGFAPNTIDSPQRFGNGSYGRFDWGQSSIRVDAGPVMAELSKADQWWGPAVEDPLILGDNAPGFLHGAIGTSRPLDIYIGRLHARAVYGKLEQSAFSPDHDADSVRLMSGFVAEFMPRGMPGLELGANRFFHSTWLGLNHIEFSQPFHGLTQDPAKSTGDNQLAEVFARWTVPHSGFEFYGEYGREDFNVDLRDLIQEPDHDAGYVLGFQRALKRDRDKERFVLRGELLNTRLSAIQQDGALRGESPWYVHGGGVEQGHTDLGQILGAPAAFGGSGASLAVDSYTTDGRWTLEWNRTMRQEQRTADGTPAPGSGDVMHALTAERLQNYGRASLVGQLVGVWDFNRDFTTATKFNLRAAVTVRSAW